MNKKTFHLFSSALLCVLLAVLMLPVGAIAQQGRQDRDRDGYDRDRGDRDRYDRDRYDRDRGDRDRYDRERYERRYSKRQVAEVITRVEQSSNRFRKDLDTALDRSRLDGSRREDAINRDVQQFEEAVNRLRREFDRNDSWWQTRRDVEQVLDKGRDVGTRMRNNRVGRNNRNLEAQWRNLRRDLNTLALRYNLPAV